MTSATIANPIWLNENRPYDEDTDFINLNGGMKWQIGEKFTVDASMNYNHSDWFRSTNTYLFNSNLNTGITVDLDANGDGVIKVTPSRDLNDLNFWNWNALRIQPVQRELWQKGGRVSGEWAFADAFKLGAGSDATNSIARSPTGTPPAAQRTVAIPRALPARVRRRAGGRGNPARESRDSQRPAWQLHADLDARPAVRDFRLRRRREQRLGAA